ncbi:ADP-ribosylation/Crystallin J1 [Stackebrandtia nassauensis DSM 44728]|uniref:ADP-ribosylation/Crystallin J1 n=2 Tax=Stackebrandtia TaxID=283810 RepID=D3Q7U4_STANL|nr:ADP-ribosylation/Crystallin J1 [Stackebrandtia nassauensis DSM 44728]
MSMEEKWDAWSDGTTLRLSRSWTGYEIYRARFAPDGDGWAVTELQVETDPSRHRDTVNHPGQFVMLVNSLLLDEDDTLEQFQRADRGLRARASLEGLSVGDALGAQFFVPDNREHYRSQTVPDGLWQWTDDTQMAAVLTTHLCEHDEVRQDELARGFAAEFDLYRGYGPGAARLLRRVRDGEDWRQLSSELFGGNGSFGNGAAMRVAPLGAWFADRGTHQVVEQAALSAEITHSHAEGIAGAVAVAVAAALAAADEVPPPVELLTQVIAATPPGAVRDGLMDARDLPDSTRPEDAARLLGNGSATTAADTVPICAWLAIHNLSDFPAAFWATASVGGDIDTNCAIVGGIVSGHLGSAAIPTEWRSAREPLPD